MGQYPRFPLFIDLTGQKVVLVGGGTIALRRARTLLQFGAQVVVIAPTLHPRSEERRVGKECRSRWSPYH